MITDDQLIRALRGLDEPVAAEPAFADELFGRLRREVGPSPLRRSWVLLAAAVLVTLVAIAAGAVLLREGPLPTLRWARAFAESGDQVRAITAFDGGYLAVGANIAVDNEFNAQETGPRAWRSIDGAVWQAVPVVAPDGIADLQSVFTGSDGSLITQSGARRAWTSVDGSRWTPLDERPMTGWPEVAASAGRYLMIASAHHGVPSGGPWRSTDGRSWSSVERPDGVSDPDWNPVGVATGDGGYVVVWCRLERSVDGSPDVWGNDCRSTASSDGITWRTSGPLPAQLRVAWYRGAWLAAGLSRDKDRVQVLRSSDGITWGPVSDITEALAPEPYDGPGPSASAVVEQLLVAGDRLVLETGPAYSRSFVSNDGVRWQPSGVTRTRVAGAASAGGGLVVIGEGWDRLDGQFWTLEGE